MPYYLSEKTYGELERVISNRDGDSTGYAQGSGTRQTAHVLITSDCPDAYGFYTCTPTAYNAAAGTWVTYSALTGKCLDPNGQYLKSGDRYLTVRYGYDTDGFPIFVTDRCGACGSGCSSGSSSGSSKSSATGCNPTCVRVVTDVQCVAGSLQVTYDNVLVCGYCTGSSSSASSGSSSSGSSGSSSSGSSSSKSSSSKSSSSASSGSSSSSSSSDTNNYGCNPFTGTCDIYTEANGGYLVGVYPGDPTCGGHCGSSSSSGSSSGSSSSSKSSSSGSSGVAGGSLGGSSGFSGGP